MLVQESGIYKITFTTKWGTYAYCKIPFGLTNASATFQKAMKMAFKGVLEKYFLVYLDDINIFSKHTVDYFDHLRQVFDRCKEYGVSLNHKKCVFSTNQGKLLGHIVLRNGLTIDLERVEEIISLPLPTHKKGL